MKKTKISAITLAVVLSLSTVSLAIFAKGSNDVANSVAKVTNKTVEEVEAERNTSEKTYGQIAAEADKLEEFKLERQKISEERLKEKVANGQITQERANEISKARNEHMESCDGSGQNEGMKLQLNKRQQLNKENDNLQQGHRKGQRLEKQNRFKDID